MNSILVKIFGWPAPLFHSDTAVFDRWLWLCERLPRDDGAHKLIDIGCGSGAFAIGAALRGYQVLGLSWDTRNQSVAAERAAMCKANAVEFEVQDIRYLDQRLDVVGKFDVAICCEVIEHIIDDKKLMRDIAGCLKPTGRLLLTTPNFFLKPIDPAHGGPFSTVEDGGHVRKGYTEADLVRLCDHAGLVPDSISHCTGFLSQKVTTLHFRSTRIHPLLGWSIIHPFRILPPLFDRVISKFSHYPEYSICLEAHKP